MKIKAKDTKVGDVIQPFVCEITCNPTDATFEVLSNPIQCNPPFDMYVNFNAKVISTATNSVIPDENIVGDETEIMIMLDESITKL